MKVLQINSVYGIGSTGRIAKDIHEMLTTNGYKSYIAYGREDFQENKETIKIGKGGIDYSHVALTRIFDKHGFGSKKSTLEFIRKVEDINPDIIHLHNIHGYYINLEILFKYLKNSNKKVIWTLHDCWSFTGHCVHFEYVGCEKWKTGCFKCPQKSEYPKSMFFDNSKLNYNKKKELFTGIPNLTIITPSKWLKNLVKQSFLKEYPTYVINNGVDLEVFKPIESTFRKEFNLEDKFLILGVANVWGERKGFDYFIKLSKFLKKNERIVLIGVNDKQKRYLPKNIIGITKTNNINELVEVYSSADIFLNPTLEDNFPTVNLEALACGKPVFTFNTGGSKESIDEHTGKIIDKEEVFQLDYRSENIFNEEDCRSRSLAFEKNKQYQKYLNLYLRG